MYIEATSRYISRGEQCIRQARFLILVGLGMTEELVPCPRCFGFGRYIEGDDVTDARVYVCPQCNRIPCNACERKGWTYDETRDEHAQQCAECKGRGDLGPSGLVKRYTHNHEIRALVRKVAMRQCGHFMMGSAMVLGRRIPLSGSYGADGLPRTVDRDVFELAVPVPPELHEAWNKGGGWNSAGSEAFAMRDWALANLKALERTSPPKKGKS